MQILRIWILAFIFVLLSAAITENDTTNQEEVDEIGDEEDKFSACTMLYLLKDAKDRGKIKKIIGKKDIKLRKMKIKAMIINKCTKTLPDNLVENIVEDDELELNAENSQYVEVNYNSTLENSFDWTLTEDEKKVLEEMGKFEKGFKEEMAELMPEEAQEKRIKKAKKALKGEMTDGEAVRDDNYRLAFCILLANQQLEDDFEKIKNYARTHNVSVNLYSRIQSMMLAKCNRTLPENLTEEAETEAKNNMPKFVGLNFTELASESFNWNKTIEEEAIEAAANDVVSKIEQGDSKEEKKKGEEKKKTKKPKKDKKEAEHKKKKKTHKKKKQISLKKKLNDWVLKNVGTILFTICTIFALIVGIQFLMRKKKEHTQ